MTASHTDRVRSLAVAVALSVLVASCTSQSGSDKQAPAGSAAGHGVTVTATTLPEGVHIEVAPEALRPAVDITTPISRTYNLTPSGTLAHPVSVTLPLNAEAPNETAVAVATAESPEGPWTLIEATLAADRRSVTFTTDHFSLFGAVGADLKDLWSRFKSAFLDPLSGNVLAEASRPRCSDETRARSDGFAISSTNASTVYWCFGMSGSERRLIVVNNRRYPLKVSHNGLAVASQPGGIAATILRVAPGDDVILPPREAATFRVALSEGSTGNVTTEFDGFAQSLYALYVGFDALAQILGLGGSPSKTVEIVGRALQAGNCLDSLTDGPMSVLAACFSPKQLWDAFGWKAVLAIPLMAFGPLLQYFRSSFNALGDQINQRDRYRISITHATPAGEGGTQEGPGTGGGGGGGTGGDPPPPPANPVATLGQGPAAPAGYRYAITLQNFPANTGVSVVCRDSVDPGGFYTFTLTTNASGYASTASYCYSGDHPDHWYTANGVESNHVTW